MTDFGTSRRRTVLFLVTEDWYFISHRLPLALAARDAGYRVDELRAQYGEGPRVLSYTFEGRARPA